ncbi:MAG: hypothetical protein ACKOKC_02625 [Chthoniobacterales bacterium]
MSDTKTDEYFELPVFTGTMQEPEPVPYEVAVRAFEEIIVALKLREKAPRVTEDIPEFKM